MDGKNQYLYRSIGKHFISMLLVTGSYFRKIESFERGLNDIAIHSGPHLGAFNAPISLPELIESVASMAALCVSGKFWCERYGENQDSRVQGSKGSRDNS